MYIYYIELQTATVKDLVVYTKTQVQFRSKLMKSILPAASFHLAH